MIVILNNRDSFVFNLARYVEELGREICVMDSHTAEIGALEAMHPDALILSPGPCTPSDAGCSKAAVKAFAGQIPILGVCLGHQVIGEVYGWTTARSNAPTHGLTKPVTHDGTGLFDGLPSPLEVGLYHSLISAPTPASPLQITARAPNGEVMALQHKTDPIYGAQFHPESILTQHGYDLMANFLKHVPESTPA